MEFPFNIFDLNSVYEFATSQSASYWISLGVTLFVSTIITGILLVVVLMMTSRQTGEQTKVANAFIVILLINAINIFGIMGLMLSFVAAVPLAGFIFPIMVWVLFIKLFFRNLDWLHAIVIGVVSFAISVYVAPYITSFVLTLIPI